MRAMVLWACVGGVVASCGCERHRAGPAVGARGVERRVGDAAGMGLAGVREIARGVGEWSGVGVSSSGRVFVGRSGGSGAPVEEVLEGGAREAVPRAGWGAWEEDMDPESGFVRVTGVHVDARDRLWVLDSGRSGSVIEGGAKLVQIDLTTGGVARVFIFPVGVASGESDLASVCVDAETETAFIADTGRGAIVSLDIRTGLTRRVLEGDPCTEGGGSAGAGIDGGVGVDAEGRFVCWRAGEMLYRAPIDVLLDPFAEPGAQSESVEVVCACPAGAAIGVDSEGRVVMTASEGGKGGELRRWSAGAGLRAMSSDTRLRGARGLAIAADGGVFVCVSGGEGSGVLRVEIPG